MPKPKDAMIDDEDDDDDDDGDDDDGDDDDELSDNISIKSYDVSLASHEMSSEMINQFRMISQINKH